MNELPSHLALLPLLLHGRDNDPAALAHILDGGREEFTFPPRMNTTAVAPILNEMIDRQYPADSGSPLVESLNRLLHRLVQLHLAQRAGGNLPGVAQLAIRVDLRDTELSIRTRVDTLEQALLD